MLSALHGIEFFHNTPIPILLEHQKLRAPSQHRVVQGAQRSLMGISSAFPAAATDNFMFMTQSITGPQMGGDSQDSGQMTGAGMPTLQLSLVFIAPIGSSGRYVATATARCTLPRRPCCLSHDREQQFNSALEVFVGGHLHITKCHVLYATCVRILVRLKY